MEIIKTNYDNVYVYFTDNRNWNGLKPLDILAVSTPKTSNNLQQQPQARDAVAFQDTFALSKNLKVTEEFLEELQRKQGICQQDNPNLNQNWVEPANLKDPVQFQVCKNVLEAMKPNQETIKSEDDTVSYHLVETVDELVPFIVKQEEPQISNSEEVIAASKTVTLKKRITKTNNETKVQNRKRELKYSKTANLDGSHRYKCLLCKKIFTSYPTFYYHQRYKCGKEPQFVCPHCPYRVYMSQSLLKHCARKHSHFV